MMKSKILPAAATAVLGFALGWAVKPAAPAKQDASASESADANGNKSGLGPRRPDSPPLVLPQRAGERPKADSEGQDTLTRIRTSTANMIANGERARDQRLSEALGLNGEQQEQITELAKKYRTGFRDLSHSGKTAADLMQEASMAEKSYDDELRKVLDPEQAQAYDAMRDRKKSNEIEDNAQRVLGEVSLSADLSPEQRDAVLAKLRENAKKSYDSRPAGYDFLTQNSSVFGNGGATSIDDIGAVLNQPGLDDPATYQKAMVEQQVATLQKRVDMMREVLTPAQLQVYQASIQSKMDFATSFKIPAKK